MMENGSEYTPAHVALGEPLATADRVTFILHGILGSGRHWRSFARGLADGAGEAVILVDLRGHGASHGAPGPNTLLSCARDLVGLEEHLGRRAGRVIGHSFGGKVALVFALRQKGSVPEVWSLDSPPGGRRDNLDPGPTQISGVLKAIERVGLPVLNRQTAVRTLTHSGLPGAVASWMGTNLVARQDGPGLVWAFDVPTVEELLSDYFEQDLWPDIRRGRTGCRVHLVQAENSDRWSAGELRRLRSVAADGLAEVHRLPDAAHWLHVDNPGGLAQLLNGNRDTFT